MPFIRVDHSRFEATANQIERYIAYTKSRMNFAQSTVNSLTNTDWLGQDAGAFRVKWEELSQTGSTYDKMIKSLSNYARYLRYVANSYKNAQTNAVNRAQRLRW